MSSFSPRQTRSRGAGAVRTAGTTQSAAANRKKSQSQPRQPQSKKRSRGTNKKEETTQQVHEQDENQQQELMKLVQDAYQNTLTGADVKSRNEDDRMLMSLDQELDDMLHVQKGAHTSRNVLQPRDMNQHPQPQQPPPKGKTVESNKSAQPIVLSPRTLLVKSNLPQVKLQQEDVTSPISSAPPMASAPAVTLAPLTPATCKIDAPHHNLPAPYVTINPDLLREAAWNFRDLQLLCMRLGLGGRGTRDQLVQRLLDWHRTCFRKKTPEEEVVDDHPLSVAKRMKHASNFSLLQFDASDALTAVTQQEIEANLQPPAAASSSTTPPISPLNDGHANAPLAHVTVSSSMPQLLTPLLYRTVRRAVDGTPRSILSPSVRPKSSSKRLSFSVFNGVKLIPNRHVSQEEEQNATPSPTKTLNMDIGSDESANNSSDMDSMGAPIPPLQLVTEFETEEQSTNSSSLLFIDTSSSTSPPSTQTPQCSPASVTPPTVPAPTTSSNPLSFFNSMSTAILNVISPRKSLAPAITLAHPSQTTVGSTTVAFTFDRLPSIESYHGDESECDTTMEED